MKFSSPPDRVLYYAQVWEVVRKIPAGKVATYGQVAAMEGTLWPDRARAQMGVARSWEAEGNRKAARDAYAAVLEMKNASRVDLAAAKAKVKAL